MMKNFLFELGTEELPLSALDVISSELPQKLGKLLKDARLDFKQIRLETTPRRTALWIQELAEKQKSETVEILGPSLEKAYDASGKPTPALEGFLRSKKAKASELKEKETPRGKFVALERKDNGQPTAKILPALMSRAVTELPFPKLMRWESSQFRFPRPIRWMVALFDRKVIPVKIGGITAARKSFGHRFLSPGSMMIQNADWKTYEKTLQKHHVWINLSEREAMIRTALQKSYGQGHPDEELVHFCAQIVEEPYLLRGRFSKTYLDLPAEVLASCMKKNQKIFAIYDARGKLMNSFVGVLNGRRNNLKNITSGYENVLESRLRDARYFYEADLKEPLEAKKPKLEQIVYLGKLGTMLQKTERLEKLAESFSVFIGRNDLKGDLKRAAGLCKIDLLTHLVYEFPELQGIAGREYALESGESKQVAEAIGSQYLPKSLTENYKDLAKGMTPFSAMLGIIDRLDLLVGAFGIGLEPTGSQDPFALRRAGGSFIKLVRAFGFHFSLNEILEEAVRGLGASLKKEKKELKDRLIGVFFKERMIRELEIEAGTRQHEIFQAVWKSSWEMGGELDVADFFDRYQKLWDLCQKAPEAFAKAVKVAERTANILKAIKEKIPSIETDLLKDPREKELYQLLEEKSPMIQSALTRREYQKATVLYGESFAETVHRFFEQVIVNADEEPVRNNRRALVDRLYRLYAEPLADLSLLSRIEIE